ncbi:uncharacterized protein LOC144467044 isoform X3 [Epinephelus lanceolatus]
MVDRSSFYQIQDAYCVDTVKDFWNEKRAAIIAQLQSKGAVVVLGDARMDSPGFSAQYCTYTTMDNDSKQIVSTVNIDKRQNMRNSGALEKEGFTQTLETLGKEVNIVSSALMPTCRYQHCSTLANTKTAVSGTLWTCGTVPSHWPKKFIRQDSIKDVKNSWTGQETFAITSGIVANQLIPMMSSSNCGEVSCTM